MNDRTFNDALPRIGQRIAVRHAGNTNLDPIGDGWRIGAFAEIRNGVAVLRPTTRVGEAFLPLSTVWE